jgi:cholinesterase
VNRTVGMRIAAGILTATNLLISVSAAKQHDLKPLQESISAVVAFGDSYLDNGTLLSLSRAAVAAKTPGAKVLPADPSSDVYPAGRWTNGPTAVEVLARQLDVPLQDYAMGGAKSGYGNYDAWLDYFADTGLQGQIESFRHHLKGQPADPRALYVIAASANDYFQFHDFHQVGAVSRDKLDSISFEELAGRVARNAAHAVAQLVSLGARRIVVCEGYLLEAWPIATTVDRQIDSARHFRESYNRALPPEIARLELQNVEVILFDWGGVTRDVISHPTKFGFTNIDRPCQPTLPRVGPACSNPDQFLWWDEWHETRHMHRLVAEAMSLKLLESALAR